MTNKLTALAVTLVLLTAACGGSPDGSTDDTASVSTTEPPTAAAPSTDQTTAPLPPAEDDLGVKPTVSVPEAEAPPDLVIVDRIVGDGDEALSGSLVSVQYVGVRYSDGGQFDASWDRGQAFEFQLGAGQVIAGWDRGVEGMRVGGRRELTIPADLAYGDRSPSPEIPAGSALVFVVDLIEIIPQFPAATTTADGLVTIENQGGEFEGNLPWSSDDTGPGLFAGDNLSPDFPNDEGLEILLTFRVADIAEVQAGTPIVKAVLTSRALQQAGTPFDDLGPLTAAAIRYESFPPTVAERVPTNEPIACEAMIEAQSLTCDVTSDLRTVVASGDERANFTLKFSEASDEDGVADIAVFFFTDPNINERGIFLLEIEFEQPTE